MVWPITTCMRRAMKKEPSNGGQYITSQWACHNRYSTNIFSKNSTIINEKYAIQNQQIFNCSTNITKVLNNYSTTILRKFNKYSTNIQIFSGKGLTKQWWTIQYITVSLSQQGPYSTPKAGLRITQVYLACNTFLSTNI